MSTITGTPAAGFALEALRVEPSTVILRGRPEALEDIRVIVTEPLSIEGVSSDQSFDAVLVLPDGVSYESGAPPEVTVTATIGPSVSSRTFIVGVVCDGAGDNACLPGFDQIAVTLSGPGEALSSLTAAALTPVLDVGGLAPGSYQITPALPALPEGVSVLGVEPSAVPVTIVAPAATPGPTPTPVP